MKHFYLCLVLLFFHYGISAQEGKSRKLYYSPYGYIVLNGYDSETFKPVESLLDIPEYQFFGFKDSLEYQQGSAGMRFFSSVLFADVFLEEKLIFFKAGLSKRVFPSTSDQLFVSPLPYSCDQSNKQNLISGDRITRHVHPVYFNQTKRYSHGAFLIIMDRHRLNTIASPYNEDLYEFSFIDQIVSCHLRSDNDFLVFLYSNFYFQESTETLLFVKYFDELNFRKKIEWGSAFSSLFELKEL